MSIDAAQPVEMTDNMQIDVGGQIITWGELNLNRHRDRNEDRLRSLKASMLATRRERDRIADCIEQAMYEAKSEETIDILQKLAGKVLLP